MENNIPDYFKHTLSEMYRLEAQVGHLPQKWKQVWDKLDVLTMTDESTWTRQTSLTTQMVRSLGRAFHKRYTVDILVRGKMVRSADLSSMIHSHRFEKHTFTTLANCDNCGSILLGKVWKYVWHTTCMG
jgi:myotubularin-related protein 5/13